MKKLTLALALLISLAAIAMSGCLGGSLNSAPPDYIKTISAVKDGNGLQLYFILADKSGEMTTADGNFTLRVIQDGRTIHQSYPINVTKSDFQKRSVGMGNFAHDVIMCYIGRLAYSDMRKIPDKGVGEVSITFITPDGKKLDGSENVFF